jgi:hypothetical protein
MFAAFVLVAAYISLAELGSKWVEAPPPPTAVRSMESDRGAEMPTAARQSAHPAPER